MEYKYKIKATEWKIAPITTGVYCIIFENSLTKRKYIGSTARIGKYYSNTGFRLRFRDHLNLLKRRKNGSLKLQNAFNKYGIESMFFYILEEIEPKLCIQREQYYIDIYKTYKEGLNGCPTAGSQLGAKRSEKDKEKMRKQRLLDSKKGKEHPNARNIFQYSVCGKFLKKWDCIADAEKFYNISLDNLSRNISLGGFCHNFIWSYSDLGETTLPKDKKWIGAFNENNTLIAKFKTRKEALRFIKKKNKSMITKALNNENLFFGGFKWKYLHYQCPCHHCQEFESRTLKSLGL